MARFAPVSDGQNFVLMYSTQGYVQVAFRVERIDCHNDSLGVTYYTNWLCINAFIKDFYMLSHMQKIFEIWLNLYP